MEQTAPHTDTAPAHGPWKASLSLGFSQRGGRTVLTSERHHGPLVIQRPFYPDESGGCHVYLLHPPGGVVGGDSITFEAKLGPGCEVLFTTPGATKYYRTAGLRAEQRQSLAVAQAGFLEWFPQETIVYEGSDVSLQTTVQLAKGASFVGWEIVCLGRRAGDQRFDSGRVRQRFEVSDESGPLVLDRALYAAKSPLLTAPWGLAGASVIGVLLIAHATQELVERIRAGWEGVSALLSATLVNGVVICRYLGQSANEAKTLFTQAWLLAKAALSGHIPQVPRIWST